MHFFAYTLISLMATFLINAKLSSEKNTSTFQNAIVSRFRVRPARSRRVRTERTRRTRTAVCAPRN